MQRCIVQEVAGLTGKACHQYHSLMRSNGQASESHRQSYGDADTRYQALTNYGHTEWSIGSRRGNRELLACDLECKK